MKKYFSKETFIKAKNFVFAHKIISIVVFIIVFGLGYYWYGKATTTTGQTRYVMTTVKKGTIISTTTGSGQVSATNQVDIVAKVSGDITWVGVTAGQTVHAGQAIASIDNTTAEQAVSDAQAALDQAKLQFQQDQASAPINYQNTLTSLTNSQNDLITEYNNTYNIISSTFLDLPAVTNGMKSILYGNTLSTKSAQWNVDTIKNMFSSDLVSQVSGFADQAESDYTPALTEYNTAVTEFQQLTRISATSTLEKMLSDSIDTTTAISQAIQSELNFLNTSVDVATKYNIAYPTGITTMQTNARSYLSTVNSDLSSLIAEKKSLDTLKQTITTDQQNITLLQVGNTNGSNPISLQIEQNNLAKQERDLQTLKDNLSYYTVVAPFAGTIASVTAQVGNPAGTVASIVTNQQIAELSLNEIDAAKISLGQKATLTFDAISNLTLTGTVAEIDPVGTVSQGVVSYNVKITFDTQDSRIKPGMTVNASVQTNVHQDVLYVPSSAVKTTGGQSYVLAFNPPLADAGTSAGVISIVSPAQIPVQIGISDDTNIEILSGLTEEQQVVSRTVTSTTATKTTTTSPSATSLLGGGRGGGGGAIRIGG